MNPKDWINSVKQRYLDEAESFLGERGLMAVETMESLKQRWPYYVKERFDPKNPMDFYTGWTGEMGASNLVTNIHDQFSRDYVVSALDRIHSPSSSFRGSWLDYGCGSAAISRSWQLTMSPYSNLWLADVENLPRAFLRKKIDEYGEYKTQLCGIDLKEVKDRSLNLILCVDVLEHLPDPSRAIRLLDRKLASGGILIVQAPWGGQPEHLDWAPIDWEREGGAQLLRENYLSVFHMNAFIGLSDVCLKRL